ncbi:MAG: chalcone isomerase family protein [Rickettsiales bacterium]|nr:chalcone isomerase family protein [Rickettsiales bacterium]
MTLKNFCFRKKISALIFLLFFSSTLSAQATPKIIDQNFSPNYLIGAADLKFLMMKVYHIELWSADQKFSYDKKFAIHIHYEMNFSKNDLAKKSIEEIKHSQNLSAEDEEKYFAQLIKIFRSVKKGDEKTAVFLPNQGLEMFYNDQLIGKISDPKLAKLFVDIWLGEKSSHPTITKKLLSI